MQFTYDKTGGGGGRYYPETGRPYSGSGADFTGGGVLVNPPRILEIGYRGFATNSADPDYDRMYVAIEDIGGDVNIVLNPNPRAQLNRPWAPRRVNYVQ